MGTPVSELVRRPSAPAVRPLVASYTGYRVAGAEPGTHGGLPSGSLTFIVAFDDPLDIAAMPAAWDLLVASGGRTSVADLADAVGWSRRHLSEEFRRTYGVRRDEDYGSRGFSVTDPENNIWSFGTYRGE